MLYVHHENITQGVFYRHGQPLRRASGQGSPCKRCVKTRPYAADISDRNWATYIHYLECKAVGHFPDDTLVKKSASVIRRCEDHADKLAAMGAMSAGLISRPTSSSPTSLPASPSELISNKHIRVTRT